ncbi:TonB-dependent receptor [Catenovulum sp. SM1970]|uniref:TonB-dependent receptor n=1 Tax=Marinifaba aquimaris TaxID=2741323 RepID=UPI001573CD93|nr:TonB-dependent receptor [Marinifaba aquimaris]NTS76738.1 TonB-dependent receptor [Marinifaba aquimaris]
MFKPSYLYFSMLMAGLSGQSIAAITQEDKAQADSKSVDAEIESKKSTPFESIQIRGIRGSLANSLNAKRFSNSIVDAVTAEDIGQFPDKNVAESLQRITGVSLTRAFGEGERISIRGTAPNQNLTSVNGQAIASADWWISSRPNRGFNYTLLPSEIVSSLEIHKSPEADHDEGSLGGSVNIKTRKPLETQDDKFVAIGLLQYSDNSGETDPQLSLLHNWRSDSDELGILWSLTRHERNLRRDGIESWGWREQDFAIGQQGQLQPSSRKFADYHDIWTPTGGGSAIFQQESIRSSATASIQWQPNENWNLLGNFLYSQLSADNTNQNFLWQPTWVVNGGGSITDFDIIDNTLAYAKFSQVEDDASFPFSTGMESIWRESEIDTSSVHLVAEQLAGFWQNSYQFGFTKGGGGTSQDNTAQWSANTAYSYDTRQTENIRTYYQADPNDASLWQLSDIRNDSFDTDDSEVYLQADFEKSVEKNLIDSFKFGAKYKDHNRSFVRYRSRNGGYDGLAAELNWSLADFETAMPSDFLAGIGDQNTLKQYAYADIGRLAPAHDELTFIRTEERESTFDITEKSFALYGKINLESTAFKGNVGLRVVHTRQDSAAWAQTDTDETGQPIYQWQNHQQSYTDFLPSLNFSFDITEDLVLRTAASRVMARPEYSQLMASTNYNLTQMQGSGGNPDLEPYRAFLFDAGLEWYFDEAALLSATVFTQEIDSFISFIRNIEVYEDVPMVIDRPTNGHGGQIQGMEFSYQQELIYGLGIIANYTYVDGKRDGDINVPDDRVAIPGHSRHTMNISGYYENEWFSGRLSYNYRTEYDTGIGEQVTDKIGQLDASLRFEVTEQLSVIFDGINLTDEIIYNYERNKYAPIGIYKNGRRLFAGVRFEL